MAISKIILNGVTQMDLTADTVEASNLLQNYTAHKNDGTQVTGTAISGNNFIITLTQNQSGNFIPDCTFAEYKAAYQAGKDISIQSDIGMIDLPSYQSDFVGCEIYVFKQDNNTGVYYFASYVFEWNENQSPITSQSSSWYFTGNATAVASDVAQGKTFFNGYGLQTGTATSSGGGSSWTKVAETSYQVSATNTATATVATWATGHSELWTSDKLVYVRIRDTAGKRNGYFYGSDQFFYNVVSINNTTATSTSDVTRLYASYSNGVYNTGTAGYGVFADTVYSDGRIRIRKRYNSTYSLTINGTYKVEVYLLDPPTGISIFE